MTLWMDISEIGTPKLNMTLINLHLYNDSFGGYIKWKVNGTTIMSNDDPTGKTWTENLSNNLKTLLWQDLGLERSEDWFIP